MAVGGGVLALRATLAELAQHCRNNAARVQNIDGHFWAGLAELFWRLLAGFLNGLSAGYASHLLLDAMTPRGIPVVAGRF